MTNHFTEAHCGLISERPEDTDHWGIQAWAYWVATSHSPKIWPWQRDIWPVLYENWQNSNFWWQMEKAPQFSPGAPGSQLAKPWDPVISSHSMLAIRAALEFGSGSGRNPALFANPADIRLRPKLGRILAGTGFGKSSLNNTNLNYL